MKYIEILEDSKFAFKVRTSCACEEPLHSITVTHYQKDGEVFLWLRNWWIDGFNVSYNLPTILWYFKCWWERIKLAWCILRTGRYEFDGEFMFKNPEHLKNFANVLLGIAQRWQEKQKEVK